MCANARTSHVSLPANFGHNPKGYYDSLFSNDDIPVFDYQNSKQLVQEESAPEGEPLIPEEEPYPEEEGPAPAEEPYVPEEEPLLPEEQPSLPEQPFEEEPESW
ncbi:MAG: hypothetical protein HY693_03525 [Deltaproteobacteria bacterium]|nr:hypothetical protein [Deltaproteobacteria bacterium]